MVQGGTVLVDLGPLEHFLKEFQRHEYKPGGPIDIALKQMGKRYLVDMARRFDKASRSPGHPWKPLVAYTQMARSRRKARRSRIRRGLSWDPTKRQGGRSIALMKNTGLLRNALNVGQPGNVYRRGDKAIYVGYGGPSKHKDLGGSGGAATISDIAMFHQLGMGNLPKREILVSPSSKTVRAMIKDAGRGLDRLARQSRGKRRPRRL